MRLLEIVNAAAYQDYLIMQITIVVLLICMGTTLPGLLLSVPYSVSEERSPAPNTC
jgi:hypothetical protein